MNQLSLQVVTWGMVSSAVTAAVLLAMAGDAASDSRRDRMTPAFMQAATSRPAAQPSHPALYARKAQRPGADVAPVSMSMPRPSRGRDDS